MMTKIPHCLIGMEACCGSHFVGAALTAQGHEVRLIPAQFVKPFLKSNKNDYLDAEAIAEAVQRSNMRFVPIKTDDQLDLQALTPSEDPQAVWDGLVHRTLGGSVSIQTQSAVMKNLDELGRPGGTNPRAFTKTSLMAALLLGSPDFQRR